MGPASCGHGKHHPCSIPAIRAATAASQRRLVAGDQAGPAPCDRLPRTQPARAGARLPPQARTPDPRHPREMKHVDCTDRRSRTRAVRPAHPVRRRGSLCHLGGLAILWLGHRHLARPVSRPARRRRGDVQPGPRDARHSDHYVRCCFLNAPWLVAYYNVEHCREVGGSGPNLDMEYLTSLGSPQTLPPIEAHLKQFPTVRLLSTAYRESPDRHFLSRSGNWRAWTFRRWRLERYFANTPGTSFNSPDSGKG